MADRSLFQVVTAIGITSSAALSGAFACSSVLAIPPLLQLPSPLLAQQWRSLYERGLARAPPLIVLSTSAYVVVASGLLAPPRQLLRSRLWGLRAAGLLTLSAIPYTLLIMNNVNATLLAKAEELAPLGLGEGFVEVGIESGQSVKELVDWWATLNAGRALLPLFGTLCALWASLG